MMTLMFDGNVLQTNSSYKHLRHGDNERLCVVSECIVLCRSTVWNKQKASQRRFDCSRMGKLITVVLK